MTVFPLNNPLATRAEPSTKRQVVAALTCGAIGISLLSLTANLLWINGISFGRQAMLLFDVDQEKSLATWWAAVTLAVLAVVTWFVGLARGFTCNKERLAWFALSAGFLFLSIDESCMLHERIGGKVELEGSFTYARWIIIWLPLALLCGSVVLWMLWRMSSRMVIGLIIGAGVFLTGAVGTEVVNSQNRYAAATSERSALEAYDFEETQPLEITGKENYAYIAGTALEEFLEMLGVVIWFGVILGVHHEFQSRSRDPKPEKLRLADA
ncbi:MAG: hypothetical protein Phyf2KO_05270 [Phycisphaerales bacterium]